MITLLGLILMNACIDTSNDDGGIKRTESTTHVVVSMLFSAGTYSTSTISGSGSAYITVSDSWRSYFSLGGHNLWLNRDDQGGTYYYQQFFAARASWWMSGTLNTAVHYAYLHENAFSHFPSATFHLLGIRGTYWLSYVNAVGVSMTLSVSDGKMQTGLFQAFYTTPIIGSLWTTTLLSVSDAAWSPQLLALRQGVSASLGNGTTLWAAGGVGKRVFYFDDEILVLYNQREVQTGTVGAGAAVRLYEQLYLLPAIEHDVFADYSVTYGSLGIRIIY